MSVDKNKMKKFTLSLLAFVVGTFSVTIANIFGGHFAAVIVAEMIVSTIYLNCILEEKDAFKNNLIDLILIGSVVLMSLTFFVTNDIVGKDVYVGDLNNFWDVCVIASQFISLSALVYTLVMFVVKSNNGDRVEIVEEFNTVEDFNSNEVYQETKTEMVDKQEKINEQTENVESNEIVEKVKGIAENNIDVDVPFMEEEN